MAELRELGSVSRGQGRSADPGAQHAAGKHIAVLIRERRQLRSAIKAALSVSGWTEQAIENWLSSS
jgi:hypothetical protein